MTEIKLYRNCKILEEKNFQVDNIETYLSTLLSKTYTNAQYIKNGLNTEIKVVLDQDYLEREVTNNYNYCRVDNGGGADDYYYYFIREMVWTAKNCIKLVLRLDVLNTFKDKYTLTDKTTIQRMHKDRFFDNSHPSLTNTFTTYLDDETVWDWSAAAGEIIGKAKFKLPDEFSGRTFTSTITLVQGQGADMYDTEYGEDGTVYITAYVQGEESQVPQGQIRVTSTSAAYTGSKLKRNIDIQPEGFDVVLMNNAALGAKSDGPNMLIDFAPLNEDFYGSYYLIYKTNNAYNSSQPDAFIYNNPINCYLCSDNSFQFKAAGDIVITPSDLQNKKYYFITWPTGADGKQLYNSFDIDYSNPKAGDYVTIIGNGGPNDGKEFKVQLQSISGTTRLRCKAMTICTAQGNTIGVYYHQLKRDNFIESDVGTFTDGYTSLTVKNTGHIKLYKSNRVYRKYGVNYYQMEVREADGYVQKNASVINTYTTKAFRDIDKTSPQLVKIIKLPYSPLSDIKSFTWNASEELPQVTFDENGYFANQLKLEAGAFTNETISIRDYIINMYSDLVISDVAPTGNETRDDKFESKLYNSDYYHQSFVYDSFQYDFKLEEINIDEEAPLAHWLDTTTYVKFVTSCSPSSTILFDFSSYDYTKSYTNHPGVLVVNRNMEHPIYNNYYMQYLRNGYNYDVKNKQTQQVASGIGIGISTAALAAGIGLSFVPGGQAFGTSAIISGVAGIAASTTSAITQSVQADKAIQQKMEAEKNKGVSVQGADDVGLLTYYQGNECNKATLVKYYLPENTKERIADLFYYCGYRCDYQAVPNTTSRLWFNFIQCNPVYEDNISMCKLGKEIKDELSSKYQQGVTVLHKVNDTWDFAQVKENWETWLF